MRAYFFIFAIVSGGILAIGLSTGTMPLFGYGTRSRTSFSRQAEPRWYWTTVILYALATVFCVVAGVFPSVGRMFSAYSFWLIVAVGALVWGTVAVLLIRSFLP